MNKLIDLDRLNTFLGKVRSEIPVKLSDLTDLTLTGKDNRKFEINMTNEGTNMNLRWNWYNGDGAGAFFRSSSSDGSFGIQARNSSGEPILMGYPNGTLTWNNKNIVNEADTSGTGNFLTGVSQSGGKLTFSKGNPSISASDLNGGILHIGDEDDNKVMIPFLNNQIAFLTQRGGSIKVTKNGTELSGDFSSMVDGTPYGIQFGDCVSTDVFVVELTLHTVLTWGFTIYYNSRNSWFRAKNIKIETINTNFSNDVWETNYSTTTNTSDYVSVFTSHTPVGGSGSGDGCNKIRFTFTDFNNTQFRIAELGVAGSLTETLVSRGGSEMFGDLTPYTSGTLHLGTSSKPWLETYTNYLHTDYINGEAVAMYRSEKRNTATSGTVTLNPNEFTSITPSANVTIALGSFSDSANYICGYHCVVNNSGNKTVTLPSGITWMGGTAPTIESGTIIELHILRDDSMLYGTYVEY